MRTPPVLEGVRVRWHLLWEKWGEDDVDRSLDAPGLS